MEPEECTRQDSCLEGSGKSFSMQLMCPSEPLQDAKGSAVGRTGEGDIGKISGVAPSVPSVFSAELNRSMRILISSLAFQMTHELFFVKVMR